MAIDPNPVNPGLFDASVTASIDPLDVVQQDMISCEITIPGTEFIMRLESEIFEQIGKNIKSESFYSEIYFQKQLKSQKLCWKYSPDLLLDRARKTHVSHLVMLTVALAILWTMNLLMKTSAKLVWTQAPQVM